MNAIHRRQFIVGSTATALAYSCAARAQPWPSRFVKLVCPIAAGGTIDGTARIVAAKLSEIWGQQVVVENKTGAAGNIAAEAVARADPDGYIESLTPREREVMVLMTRGKANKVMAAELGVSQRTVEIHRARVMEKSGAASLAQLVRMVMDLESGRTDP